MEVCKIVIPSHKRHTRVTTTSVVDGCIICVAESQEKAYRMCNPIDEIATHPDSVVGLARKRDWIINHFGSVFMLDDDIDSFRRLYTEKGESADVDAKDAYEIIQVTADAARQAGAYLFGFSSSPAPVSYNSLNPVQLSGYVTGCAHGVLKGSRLWYSPEIRCNEDYWISCLNAYEHRLIWKDTRFYFDQRDTFVNAGGLAEFRNFGAEEQDFNYLQKIFGSDVVTLKKAGGKSQLKHPFQKTISLPFS
ncbi:GREB1-related protein [Arsenicibacter rosenii]|uniref:TET-Associated Glycosyltransferase domain-containing protein n=1 Tax=Arsenicibacter rosenii TaxID=1750698 RepID=A0A1S2VTD7_9BACT|nr:hypothetical protein [Arsenicibacter rosenii]OIN61178.1 hypothetical protein BLX24_03720 [Arsenicibacter rosenii]